MRVVALLYVLPLLASLASAAGTKQRPGQRPNAKKLSKYFREAGPTEEQGHYDGRFFKGMLSYEEQRPELRRIIRAYLTIFRSLGIETWLAHGTLLGWWWNGQIMPWDGDLDVQVSSATLHYLAQNLNGTLHEYKYLDDETGLEETRTYMLDVNPHYIDRARGDGQNVIDARWVDTTNGKFVDITGLAERNAEAQPGIWSCKNYHRYRSKDLYPMRETEFEGVTAMIPYAFDRVLTEEYGIKSLVTTQWKG
jgi:hypothetical protein